VYAATSSFCLHSKKPLSLLKNNSLFLKKNTKRRKLNQSELIQDLSDCVGVIAGTEEYREDVISKLNKLKVISRLGVGTDNIDINYALSKGIKIFTTENGPYEAVAELVITYILSFYRHINQSFIDLKNGIWNKRTGYLLSGKTVGIIGFGNIGKQVARLLQPFNCQILTFDLLRDKDFEINYGVKFVDINELLKKSNIITLHLNLNPKTRHFINQSTISKMKKDCLLINTSRGEIIDEKSLYNNLSKGHLLGACLDVFENEPYNGLLRELDNVLLTPHIGSYARETRIKLELEATENLITGIIND